MQRRFRDVFKNIFSLFSWMNLFRNWSTYICRFPDTLYLHCLTKTEINWRGPIGYTVNNHNGGFFKSLLIKYTGLGKVSLISYCCLYNNLRGSTICFVSQPISRDSSWQSDSNALNSADWIEGNVSAAIYFQRHAKRRHYCQGCKNYKESTGWRFHSRWQNRMFLR